MNVKRSRCRVENCVRIQVSESDDECDGECILRNVRGRVADSTGKLNEKGHVDSACLTYDPEMKSYCIRLDHSSLPEFWIQIPVPEECLERAKKLATNSEEPKRSDGELGESVKFFDPNDPEDADFACLVNKE